MKNVAMFLTILFLVACSENRVEYIELNHCAVDICNNAPQTVKDYVEGYYCKSDVIKTCYGEL